MVMAGMGFDAAIMEGVNEEIKAKVGWIAYVLSALKSLMFPAVRVEISVDGGEFTTHRARTIVVGNVGYLQAGMPLLPDASIDDGLLDVVLLHPRRFLSWIPLAFRVLAKRPRTDELVDRMTGRTVVVRASADTPRQLDGDSIGPGRELHMECIHGRVLVRVPPVSQSDWSRYVPLAVSGAPVARRPGPDRPARLGRSGASSGTRGRAIRHTTYLHRTCPLRRPCQVPASCDDPGGSLAAAGRALLRRSPSGGSARSSTLRRRTPGPSRSW